MSDLEEEFARFAAEIDEVERLSKLEDGVTEGSGRSLSKERSAKPHVASVAAPPQRKPIVDTSTPVLSTKPPDIPVVAPNPSYPPVPEAPAPLPAVGKAIKRSAGGETWVDPSLAAWPENDARLFVGNLGKEVTDEVLAHAFKKYPSFIGARVVMDKQNHVTKGYGFVSFSDPADLAKALREMNNKFVGTRPVKLKKSNWQERTIGKASETQGNVSAKHKPQHKRKHLFSKHFKPY